MPAGRRDAGRRAELVLDAGLRVDAGGGNGWPTVWRSIAPRQSGKGEAALVRILAGALCFGERLIVYSAHEAATAFEHFTRMVAILEGSRELSRRVRRVSRAPPRRRSRRARRPVARDGRRELCRILFRSRTKVGARGFAGADVLVFDEAQILPESVVAALLPVLVTRPGSQAWFLATAPDARVHTDALALARLERPLAGDDPRLAFLEWSARDAQDAELLVHDDEALRALTRALPRVPVADVEHGARDDGRAHLLRGAARHRRLAGDRRVRAGGLPLATWRGLLDTGLRWPGRVALSVDVAVNLRAAAICAAASIGDGRVMVGVLEHRPGVEWVDQWLAELTAAHRNVGVAIDLATARALGLS